MNWDTLKLILKRLTEQLGFRRVGSHDREDRRVHATISHGSMSDRDSKPYRPDIREKRHEFSQHIGC
jgi:hypothetical protein